ncbi:MAG: hypothetical protein EOP37_03205 [Rubrivivax sp.]|nr:MAG: hypothetical protein EOP37_03205 [Rubrivivax sp.]
MKEVGIALAAALGRPVQRPAVFVEAQFSTVQRWTSGPTTTWNGNVWTSTDLDVQDLLVQAYTLSGSLVLGNSKNEASALVINEGVVDRQFRIWAYDLAAPTDVVVQCTALGGACDVGEQTLSITLRHPCDGMVSPRTFITAADFGSGLPDGATIRIAGIDYQINRKGS